MRDKLIKRVPTEEERKEWELIEDCNECDECDECKSTEYVAHIYCDLRGREREIYFFCGDCGAYRNSSITRGCKS